MSLHWEKLKEKGNQAYSNKNYSEAISYYTDALSILIKLDINSNIDTLYSNRSLCLKALGKYQSAINDLVNALMINHRNTKNLLRLFQLYIIVGNLNVLN